MRPVSDPAGSRAAPAGGDQRAPLIAPDSLAMRLQSSGWHLERMAEPQEEIDAALDTAIQRVREAEDQFLEESPGTEAAVVRALDVEQRAEDVEELATDALELSDDVPG